MLIVPDKVIAEFLHIAGNQNCNIFCNQRHRFQLPTKLNLTENKFGLSKVT